ncbi:hypothetical protein [Methanolobus chelungpuianus]|uniref:hypothetical protein n=1 Tax=Methanolobus chelungpuianus TaxID=502115 RepID=UPI002113EB96|nr:hypothetical protein [Methanolobus chelungpuianus]
MLNNECGCKIPLYGFGDGRMEHDSLYGTLSSLGCSPVYFSESNESCYWFDSRGLSLRISGTDEMSDVNYPARFQSMLEIVFKYIYFNETVDIARFSDNLLSGVRETVNFKCGFNGGIIIFIPWRSIALIILSGRGPGMGDIDIMIGDREYSIPC